MVKKIIASVLLCFVLPLSSISTSGASVVNLSGSEPQVNELESLTQSEYIKLAEALDITKTNTSVDMGNSYTRVGLFAH